MKAHDEFVEAFDRFIQEVSIADAMSVATGLFVSLVVSWIELKGEDPSKKITINGGDQRDITIHAQKPATGSQS